MFTIFSKKRIYLYLIFFISIIILSFLGSVIAIYITGSRAYAGLGLVIFPPIVQLIFSFKFVNTSTLIKIILTALVSIITYLSSMAVIEFGLFNIGLDRYGYFDFLVLYALLSILVWEIIHTSMLKLKKIK